jgi:hypothetical protein
MHGIGLLDLIKWCLAWLIIISIAILVIHWIASNPVGNGAFIGDTIQAIARFIVTIVESAID